AQLDRIEDEQVDGFADRDGDGFLAGEARRRNVGDEPEVITGRDDGARQAVGVHASALGRWWAPPSLSVRAVLPTTRGSVLSEQGPESTQGGRARVGRGRRPVACGAITACHA